MRLSREGGREGGRERKKKPKAELGTGRTDL